MTAMPHRLLGRTGLQVSVLSYAQARVGKGLMPMANPPATRLALERAGCSRLCVLTVPEGVEVRDAGVELPVLVLVGARDDAEAAHAVELLKVGFIYDNSKHSFGLSADLRASC